MILAQATIADIVLPKDRGKYVGPLGAIFGLSAVLGQLLGGWFAEGVGWRWVFWMNLPLGLIALATVVAFLRLPHRSYQRPRLDVAGTALLWTAVTCFVLFTSCGGNYYKWTSPVIIGPIVAAVVVAAVFILVQRRAAEPLMPPSLFKERNFNLATSAGLLTMPTVGTVFIGGAMWLLSTFTVTSPIWVISLGSGLTGRPEARCRRRAASPPRPTRRPRAPLPRAARSAMPDRASPSTWQRCTPVAPPRRVRAMRAPSFAQARRTLWARSTPTRPGPVRRDARSPQRLRERTPRTGQAVDRPER